jgi:hypothetical protein
MVYFEPRGFAPIEIPALVKKGKFHAEKHRA